MKICTKEEMSKTQGECTNVQSRDNGEPIPVTDNETGQMSILKSFYQDDREVNKERNMYNVSCDSIWIGGSREKQGD